MTDDLPVFVIHGIANRERSIIEDRVAQLSSAALHRWSLHPVYWGDLGAAALGAKLAMPPEPGQPWQTRGEFPPEPDGAELGLAGPVPLDPPTRLELVRSRAGSRLARPDTGMPSPTPEVTAAALDAIAEAWPGTRWLGRTDDAALLAAVGEALADAALAAVADDASGHEVRDPGPVRRVIRRHLPQLDRIAGAAIGNAGERLYTWVRNAKAHYLSLTLGDVLVYQRHGEAIREHIREQIRTMSGGGGDAGSPVHLIGHSLGAVIALDLATAEEPVHTAGLVTFGCQWPLFHVFDPRGGQLAPYDGTGPVLLPPDSLLRWTNLWHPLDPLGFVASRLFGWADRAGPVDQRVDHLLSDDFYTHSSYWSSPSLVAALHSTFTPAD
ncbi:hypothetical protein AB0B85_17100 [Micromonospora sp. NPDC049044]|uniref:hypothetical protein n=1 Tax=unclassified Micromonospora TaxID=2617518 RepID=UPI0033CA94CB